MPMTKPNVLLVDDDENLLHALTRSLRKQPYQIFTARSGPEAIWALKTNDIDVLVSDEQMPGMTGSDLLAWAAVHAPDTARVVLTGQANAAVAIRAINEGRAYHFFTKPCDPTQLAIIIDKAIEHRLLVREHARLQETSRRYRGEVDRLEGMLVLLGRLLSQDLERPLQQTARHCRTLAERYSDVFDPQTQRLVETALEAAGEARRMVSDIQDAAFAASSDQAAVPPPAEPLHSA